MRKEKTTTPSIRIVANDEDKERELTLDLKNWLEDESFEPPFPYNVLWDDDMPRTERMRIMAKAARLAYESSLQRI